jgi:hypothetical protein
LSESRHIEEGRRARVGAKWWKATGKCHAWADGEFGPTKRGW